MAAREKEKRNGKMVGEGGSNGREGGETSLWERQSMYRKLVWKVTNNNNILRLYTAGYDLLNKSSRMLFPKNS